MTIKRTQILVLIFVLCLLGIVARLLYLQFSERHFLRKVAESAYTRREKDTVLRGVITDRSGAVIAVSTPMYDVWVNPQHFDFDSADFAAVARLLELNVTAELKTLHDKKSTYFVYLKRQVSPNVWAEVKALKVPGVYAELNQKRFYPDGEVLAQVVGFVDVDDTGQEGVELEYNAWLSGQAGVEVVQKDLQGNQIMPGTQEAQTQAAKSIALSIDRRLQFLVYQALEKGVQKNAASSGSAVILDLQTGEILAMANYPSFNPNERNSLKPGESRNRVVTDTVEPGSVIKPFAAIAALREGKFKLTDVVDTSPGQVYIGRNLVRDEENYGQLTLQQILQKSSNVGITYVVTHISPDSLPSLLKDVGFGRSVNLHFPGEATGFFPHRKDKNWPPFELATMSFGYGFSVSLLQLAQAYAVLGSGGWLRQPTLLRVDQPMPAHRVLEETYAKEMLQALTSVVEKGGTAVRGDLDNYQVTGKTGTARKAIPGGYSTRLYRGFFVGIAPLSNPRLVMAVMIDEPRKGRYHGGEVAAPVFKDAMDQILPLLDIPADKLSEKPKSHKK